MLPALLALLIAPTFAASITLEQAYRAALEKTEEQFIQDARTLQADERVSQLKGAIYPSVALNAAYTRQHRPDLSGATSVSNAFQRPDQYNARITLTQPLFRGFSEFAALGAARAQLRSQEGLSRQARSDAYGAVARAYYDVLIGEQDVRNLKTQLDLIQAREKDLAQRSRIGRSRKGELLSAQSQAAVLVAQLEAAETALSQSRDTFAFVTGLGADTALGDVTVIPDRLAPASAWLDRSEERGDIVSARELLSAQEDQVTVAKGGHWPTVDFTGNYWIKRTGILEPVKWDLGLAFSLPIFQGGVVRGQTREAVARSREAELTLARARRLAAQQIQLAHKAAQNGIVQIRSLAEAAETSERNYREQVREYGFGLTTNLEVLQALNAHVESRRALDRARFQAKAALAQLEAAAGAVK